MTIAIMSAMHEEIASLISAMEVEQKDSYGSRTYYVGKLCDEEVVVVFSHWGKVAASITATTLINRYAASEVLFTGVAGAIVSSLSVGDIVVADTLYQHDMDASPIIERHEIPLLGRAGIKANTDMRDRLCNAAQLFIKYNFEQSVYSDIIAKYKLAAPKVRCADVASGDQFVANSSTGKDIVSRLESVVCVEMEGAAVAQVCESFDIPFAVVRTISDSGDESADIDFQAFVTEVASTYSIEIISNYLHQSRTMIPK